MDPFDGAGHHGLAEEIRSDLVGRNVISGRWTFQVVEEFDDHYWQTFRGWDRSVREQLLDGRRHVYEAQMGKPTGHMAGMGMKRSTHDSHP